MFATLSELTAMIDGTVAAWRHDPKMLRKAMKACQWRLVTADGLAVQPCTSAFAKPALGLRETGVVFDGRDNEAMKQRYFQAMLGVPLAFDILPQIVCAS